VGLLFAAVDSSVSARRQQQLVVAPARHVTSDSAHVPLSRASSSSSGGGGGRRALLIGLGVVLGVIFVVIFVLAFTCTLHHCRRLHHGGLHVITPSTHSQENVCNNSNNVISRVFFDFEKNVKNERSFRNH